MSHLEECWLAAWLYRSRFCADEKSAKTRSQFCHRRKDAGGRACADRFSYQITVLESVRRRCESLLMFHHASPEMCSGSGAGVSLVWHCCAHMYVYIWFTHMYTLWHNPCVTCIHDYGECEHCLQKACEPGKFVHVSLCNITTSTALTESQLSHLIKRIVKYYNTVYRM